MKTGFGRVIRIGAVLLGLLATGLMPAPLLAQQGGPRTPPLLMTSPGWEDGGVLPDKYTRAAGPAAVSPELQWSQVPAGTRSFVLLVHDPEPVVNKSSKMDITHWLVWNIPASATGLPEGVKAGTSPDGSRQVSVRTNGYTAPGAAAGPYHHYTFQLYALDIMLDVPQGTPQQVIATRNAVFDAMDGHVLGKAEIVGRFHQH
jgi:Raf kinase inhibitor-like YbhB/YbcL family protein